MEMVQIERGITVWPHESFRDAWAAELVRLLGEMETNDARATLETGGQYSEFFWEWPPPFARSGLRGFRPLFQSLIGAPGALGDAVRACCISS